MPPGKICSAFCVNLTPLSRLNLYFLYFGLNPLTLFFKGLGGGVEPVEPPHPPIVL